MIDEDPIDRFGDLFLQGFGCGRSDFLRLLAPEYLIDAVANFWHARIQLFFLEALSKLHSDFCAEIDGWGCEIDEEFLVERLNRTGFDLDLLWPAGLGLHSEEAPASDEEGDHQHDGQLALLLDLCCFFRHELAFARSARM